MDGIQGSRYDIHFGQIRRFNARSLIKVLSRNRKACSGDDRCSSPDGRVLGAYIQGFFDTPALIRCWLVHIGLDNIEVNRLHGPAARDRACDLLAEHAAGHIDVNEIFELIGKAGIPKNV
jgi:adenosylcobyric acid synthase